MAGQKGVKNVKYIRSRHKPTKARKCKSKGCKKCVREENKSGYCSNHYGQCPKGIVARFKIAKEQKEKYISINLDRQVHKSFSDFCEEYGFNKKRKLELIIKDFLIKRDAVYTEGEENVK